MAHWTPHNLPTRDNCSTKCPTFRRWRKIGDAGHSDNSTTPMSRPVVFGLSCRHLRGDVPSICITPRGCRWKPSASKCLRLHRRLSTLFKQSSLLPVGVVSWSVLVRIAEGQTSFVSLVVQKAPPPRLWLKRTLTKQSSPAGWALIKQSFLLSRRERSSRCATQFPEALFQQLTLLLRRGV